MSAKAHRPKSARHAEPVEASPSLRPTVYGVEIDQAIEEVKGKLAARLIKHGPGAYASVHETLGIVAEEYHELIDEITANDTGATEQELIDIAVACIFGLASMRTQRLARGVK